MGDCRRGSHVKAKGNVIVLGRLLGRVTAGSEGDRSAVVVAGEMQPSKIRIADVDLKPSYWHRAGAAFGQVAFINSSGVEGDTLPDGDNLSREEDIHSRNPEDRLTGSQLQPTHKDAGSRPHIKITPLARPYLSFGPDVRQHPCASSARPQKMPAAAKSAAITGCYAIALGISLMIAPMTLFSILFDPGVISMGFVKLGGALLAVFGLYYIGATLGSSRGSGVSGFYASTVAGRFLLAAFCVWLFISGDIGAGIIFFAVMNGIGAISMAHAMRLDNEPASMTSYV